MHDSSGRSFGGPFMCDIVRRRNLGLQYSLLYHLMIFIFSGDPISNVTMALDFASKEDAIRFCLRQGINSFFLIENTYLFLFQDGNTKWKSSTYKR